MATVGLKGVDLFYEEKGKGSPLLLIHGAGADADTWSGVMPEFAKHHRVISYDRRGYTRSIHAPVKDFHTHGEDAAALIRTLGAEPATVVGWSGGGIAAIDLTVNHPDLVSTLILEEPPLHAKKHPSLQMTRTFAKVQILSLIGRDRAAAKTFFRWANGYTTGGSSFDRFPESTRRAMLDNAPALLAEVGAGTGEYLSVERIASIRCPVTLLLGELTPRPIADATRRLAGILKQAEVVSISGASHAMHFDHPEEFVSAVQRASAFRN